MLFSRAEQTYICTPDKVLFFDEIEISQFFQTKLVHVILKMLVDLGEERMSTIIIVIVGFVLFQSTNVA